MGQKGAPGVPLSKTPRIATIGRVEEDRRRVVSWCRVARGGRSARRRQAALWLWQPLAAWQAPCVENATAWRGRSEDEEGQAAGRHRHRLSALLAVVVVVVPVTPPARG